MWLIKGSTYWANWKTRCHTTLTLIINGYKVYMCPVHEDI